LLCFQYALLVETAVNAYFALQKSFKQNKKLVYFYIIYSALIECK
jgi:hypothetical protein